MAWITLSTTDVQQTLSSAEASKVAALVPANSLSEITLNVVREIRGYVRRQTTPGAGDTIPETLKASALIIARYRFLASVSASGVNLITEPRTKEYDNALKLLRDVASGDFILEEAVTPSSESAPMAGPSVVARDRSFTQADQDGI